MAIVPPDDLVIGTSEEISVAEVDFGAVVVAAASTVRAFPPFMTLTPPAAGPLGSILVAATASAVADTVGSVSRSRSPVIESDVVTGTDAAAAARACAAVIDWGYDDGIDAAGAVLVVFMRMPEAGALPPLSKYLDL